MFPGPLQLIQQREYVAFLLLALSLVLAIGLHEYAHALMADLQGDRLPRAMGRLTPNPIKHLDPLGTVMLVLVGFGWGKPVEFRPQALSSKRFGAALVALAGPLMNVMLAVVGALLFSLLKDTAPRTVLLFLLLFFSINAVLAVFNLLPLPPLDGSRLLTIFLPPSRQNIIFFLDRYGFMILLAVVLLGNQLLTPIFDFAQGLVGRIAGF